MLAYEALRVADHPIDKDVCDAGLVGPELAYLADMYRASPRAIIFRQPSSEWRLFIVFLPIASRLSMLGNPIFSSLVRAWGHNLRFIGIDHHNMVYDFRSLLSNAILGKLINWLQREEVSRAINPTPDSINSNPALDILFASLSRDMLTVLDKRRNDWSQHLDTSHRLEPGLSNTLFDRSSRYPDFITACRQALRNNTIDSHQYGRILRAIEEREVGPERQAAQTIEDCLDKEVIRRLHRANAGIHLGCYNWLKIAPRHAPMRSHILNRLPAFAAWFAETLLPLDGWQQSDELKELDPPDEVFPPLGGHTGHHLATNESPDFARAQPNYDLKKIAHGEQSSHNLMLAIVLKKAIDAGQDRTVINALANRFGISANTLRLLWHDRPAALAQPASWHLIPILQNLDTLGRFEWPTNDAQWRDIVAAAIPVHAI